jgi:hypothetical protein
VSGASTRWWPEVASRAPSSCTTDGLFVERSTRIEPAGAVVVHSSATWRTAAGDGSDSIVISAAFPTSATDAAASAPSMAATRAASRSYTVTS